MKYPKIKEKTSKEATNEKGKGKFRKCGALVAKRREHFKKEKVANYLNAAEMKSKMSTGKLTGFNDLDKGTKI